MIFTAPKIIAGIISTIWAFTTFLSVARTLPEADSSIIPAAYYEAVLPASTTVAPTTTVTTIATCDDALQLALDLGFPADQLGTLDMVMYRESRCLPHAFNPDDPNGGSYSLTQINGFWCLPNSNWPIGWLQEKASWKSAAICSTPRSHCAPPLRYTTIQDGHHGQQRGK
jgi:hypothetical protein